MARRRPRPAPRRGIAGTALRADRLGLGRALSSRLLPALVAAMSFLAALALAGVIGAAHLAGRWDSGTASLLTVQVPQPDDPAASGAASRLARVDALLAAAPEVQSRRRLTPDELRRLLAPWLGEAAPADSAAGQTDPLGALPLPAVVQVRLHAATALPEPLTAAIAAAAPGTLVEANDVWGRRLARLADSLQACAGLALLLVGLVAAGVIAVAARSSLGARRQTVEIVHGLGASPGEIAGRFARRACLLAAIGGCLGALAALPVLIALARLAAPFAAAAAAGADPLRAAWAAGTPSGLARALYDALPPGLWTAMPLLPVGAAAIGWGATQATVRAWLRRL